MFSLFSEPDQVHKSSSIFFSFYWRTLSHQFRICLNFMQISLLSFIILNRLLSCLIDYLLPISEHDSQSLPAFSLLGYMVKRHPRTPKRSTGGETTARLAAGDHGSPGQMVCVCRSVCVSVWGGYVPADGVGRWPQALICTQVPAAGETRGSRGKLLIRTGVSAHVLEGSTLHMHLYPSRSLSLSVYICIYVYTCIYTHL